MKKQNKLFDNPILKTVTKILSWIILVFLVLIAGLLIYNIVSSKLYEIRGQKYEPEISLYTIISPSMEPNINVYDVVVTKKVKDYSTIKEGDIITFISTSSLGEGLTVTHRVKSVIKTDDDIKFRTQGDNNPIPDSSLASSSNVLGKVVLRIPWVGHIQFLLQSKGGWLFALLIPAMIVVIYDVVKVIRLSNIKQKVNESIKEKPEDQELTEKKEKLKKDLKEKYEDKNIESNIFDDKVESNDDRKESIFEKESKVAKEKEQEEINKRSIKKVEEVIENDKIDINDVLKNNDIDVKDVLKNIKEIEKEEKEFDVNKIMSNISRLETTDDEDFEMPKAKE